MVVELYMTLCLWSTGAPVCNEVPLTPGAAGKSYTSMEACEADEWAAINNWWREAGPVFGINDWKGDGYRIRGLRCAPRKAPEFNPDGDEV